VAENVKAVIASFKSNVAVPNDAGLGPPVVSVGVVGGFSWEFVRFANKMVFAYPLVAISNANAETRRVVSRNIIESLLKGVFASIMMAMASKKYRFFLEPKRGAMPDFVATVPKL
jgi:hypothetical protein